MNELPDAGGAGLERALEALEAEALALLEVVSSVARVAKRAKAAAETGTEGGVALRCRGLVRVR